MSDASTVIDTPVSELMSKSYLSYAMSVIVDRSLPDVRDGLKPVHRRILYAMYESGNTHNKPYKKSARMVGDVIGKYHPHGDTAVYEAAVRMAQPFSMRQTLIDGQGNFGSIDGDSPAAMRYTEMRMGKVGAEFFKEIKQETVAFRDNYDGEESEPVVLPASYPNLLVNGVDGIAVGLATSMPPHNFNAVADATLHLIDHDDASTAEIVSILKAPDFPTGGIVYGLDGFASAVESGTGKVKLRAKWHEEDRRRGTSLVITEIPYQVNKVNLVKKIAELVKNKEIEDIVGLRDESSKKGVRIVIDLKQGASAEVMFATLIAKTNLEVTISYNCTVLDTIGDTEKVQPVTMGLKDIMLRWIKFRQDVITKKYIFLKKEAMAKLHILDGYIAALGKLDEVIKLIREADTPKTAREGLMSLLSVDEQQAQAILDLRLQKLTGMEIKGLEEEHANVKAKVAEFTQKITTPALIREEIKEELSALKNTYGQERTTEIGSGLSTVTREDLIPREEVLLAVTQLGYVKRMPVDALNTQKRGTRGRRAIALHDNDAIASLYQVHTHDLILVFGRSGQVYATKAYQIPQSSIGEKGRHIKNFIPGFDETIDVIIAVPESSEEKTLVTITEKGIIKRSNLSDYATATRKGGIRGLNLNDGDKLRSAFVINPNDHLMLVNNVGRAVRFSMESVRTMGRTSTGIRGMKLSDSELVVGALVIDPNDAIDQYLVCIGDKGMGKRTHVSEFGVKGRGGKGMIAFNVTQKTGDLVSAFGIKGDLDIVLFASDGVSNKIHASDIRITGRAASGVKLMNVKEGERVVSVTTALRTVEEEGEDSVDDESPLMPQENGGQE